MKRILSVLCLFLLVALSCSAQLQDKELETSVTISVEQMKKELAEGWGNKIYVREKEDKDVAVYSGMQKPESTGKLIVLNMTPDEVTYIYTNDKKVYKKLYSRLRYYAGRNYDFNGYRLITEKEGVREIAGADVYCIWAMKVLRPWETVVHHDVCCSGSWGRFPVIVMGGHWPHHHCHPRLPRGGRGGHRR